MFEFYQFQSEDINKLIDQPAALIGSDMGTGKTHEGIQLIHEWRKQVYEDTGKILPALIVCPFNVIPSWVNKFEMQLPDYRVATINPKKRKEFVDTIINEPMAYDVYIMHWQAVRLVSKEFLDNKVVFAAIVGDEVHAISNHKSKVAVEFKKLKAYSKLGISGTASGDKPWNLWSVLNWLRPDVFTSFWRFVDQYVAEEYDEVFRKVLNEDTGKWETNIDRYRKFVSPKNTEILHWTIDPYYVRHLKDRKCCEHHPDGVMSWLPPLTTEHVFIDLTPTQARLYHETLTKMVAWLDDGQPLVSPMVVAQQSRLAQIALATPAIVDDKVYLTDPSPKLDYAVNIIKEYDELRILVYTTSKLAAKLLQARLDNIGIPCGTFTGDTSNWDRKAIISDFGTGKIRVIVATISSISEGVDGLQRSCHTILFLDRDREPYKNEQAIARLLRDGQNNNILVIDLIAKDTLDELWVLKRLPEKYKNLLQMLDKPQ